MVNGHLLLLVIHILKPFIEGRGCAFKQMDRQLVLGCEGTLEIDPCSHCVHWLCLLPVSCSSPEEVNERGKEKERRINKTNKQKKNIKKDIIYYSFANVH